MSRTSSKFFIWIVHQFTFHSITFGSKPLKTNFQTLLVACIAGDKSQTGGEREEKVVYVSSALCQRGPQGGNNRCLVLRCHFDSAHFMYWKENQTIEDFSSFAFHCLRTRFPQVWSAKFCWWIVLKRNRANANNWIACCCFWKQKHQRRMRFIQHARACSAPPFCVLCERITQSKNFKKERSHELNPRSAQTKQAKFSTSATRSFHRKCTAETQKAENICNWSFIPKHVFVHTQ